MGLLRLRSVKRLGYLTLLAATLSLGHSTNASAKRGDWPQYRGPAAGGAATAAGVFERSVGIGLKVAWKKKLGSGYSSVAVADGRVVTMFSEAGTDVVAAYDEDSGKQLWRHAIEEGYAGHDGSHDGPLSTPSIAGGHVVGLSARGSLFAVKADSGEPVWSVNIAEEYGATAPFYGFGASPLIVGDTVVLELGSEESAVAGFELASGERRWLAGKDGIQYQTPAVMRLDGRDVLVAAGNANFYGIDPSDGKVLWEHPHEGAPGDYGAGSVTPVPAGEGRVFLSHKNDGSKMLRVFAKDGKYQVESLWENRHVRHSYNIAVYHDGNLYAFSSRFLICLDAATGEPRWRSREPGDGFLILVDGHLVIVTKAGSVHVVPASPDGFEEVANLDVFDEHAWAAPGFADGGIFVRSLGELARIDIGRGRALRVAKSDSDRSLRGTRFGRFLSEVERSEDKQALVDRFFESVDSFPIVDGRDRVHFVYRGTATDVAVAGDLIGVALEAPMTRVEGTDLFYHSMKVEDDVRASYVLIKDYEEILDPRNPRKASIAVVGEDMELSFGPQDREMSWFAMPGWQEPRYLSKPEPGRQGRLESRELDSELLGGKLGLDVYLPAGYDEGSQRYPVIYVHGGTAAQEKGQWPTALDNLIGRSVAPLIAVFVGPARAQLPQYADMFAKELVPFVDSNFRTRADASSRGSFGTGFGGVAAFFCALATPDLVGKMASQSGFFFEFALTPLQSVLGDAESKPLDVYMDWGSYDLRNQYENWDLGKLNQDMDSLLREKGYRPSGGEVHEGSGWPSWRNRTDRVLEALFPMKTSG